MTSWGIPQHRSRCTPVFTTNSDKVYLTSPSSSSRLRAFGRKRSSLHFGFPGEPHMFRKSPHFVSLPQHTRASNTELRTQACPGISRQVTWALHSAYVDRYVRAQRSLASSSVCNAFSGV